MILLCPADLFVVPYRPLEFHDSIPVLVPFFLSLVSILVTWITV